MSSPAVCTVAVLPVPGTPLIYKHPWRRPCTAACSSSCVQTVQTDACIGQIHEAMEPAALEQARPLSRVTESAATSPKPWWQ
jgi:hypothetical protein